MRVIATAGHVDHGKSTLVRALTGTDPDRLAEEKQRGLTIDLGFAGLALPSGEKLAFVDVPGHRRFIGNMLAGLGPAPVVMLVVAADQGWQAQSTEHLEAIDALGLSHGLVVLTRCGLADETRVAAVRREALAQVSATSLGSVPVIETDAVTGQGMDELREALDALVTGLPALEPEAAVRLWIDRSFTIKGAGTVVTGTLAAGTLHVGDTVEISGERVVVRSLQVLGESAKSVGPVSRVAVGLRGLSRQDVGRGDVLRTPNTGRKTAVIDVRRTTGRYWQDAASEVSIHLGSAARSAHVRPLDDESARLTLSEPLDVRVGDQLIIRDDSAARIHCGAVVLDCDPARFTRRGAGARRAEVLREWVPRRAADIVNDRGFIARSWFERQGVSGHDLGAQPGVTESHGHFVADWQKTLWASQIRSDVEADAANELSRGVAVKTLAGRFDIPDELMPMVIAAAQLRVDEGRVASAQHASTMGAAEQALEAVRSRLLEKPFDAPEGDELAGLNLGARELAAAAARGQILRLSGGVVLLPDAPARAMRVLAGLEQPFTASAARSALGSTRRVVIPLLEYLDARGWTRREGNVRFVVR